MRAPGFPSHKAAALPCLPPSPQPRPVQVSEQRPVSHLVTLNFTWLKKIILKENFCYVTAEVK